MGGELRYQIGQNAYIKLILHALKHRSSAVNGVLLGRLSGGDSNPVVEITDSVPLFHSQIGLLPPLEIALIHIEEYYGAQGLSIVGYFHANERFDDSELGNVAKNIGDHIHRYFSQAGLLLLDNKKLEALPKGKDRSPVIQIEEYYGAQGLSIVGYFHANERFDDSELGNIAKNIGDHIHRYFSQAGLLLLDNKKLKALPKGNDRSPVIQLYTRDSSKSWKLIGDGSSRLTMKEPAANIVLLDYISNQKWQDIVDFDDHLDDISKDWLNPELFSS